MKRWISLALTLIITLSYTQGGLLLARAEEMEEIAVAGFVMRLISTAIRSSCS